MKYETRREQALRMKRNRRSRNVGLFLAFILILIVGIVAFTGKKSLEAKNTEYEVTKASLQAQIEEQQTRKAQIEEYQKYIQTKKFVEEMAKDKFGLIYPDELVFRAKDK